jgi:shikimate-5-dehydrogenase
MYLVLDRTRRRINIQPPSNTTKASIAYRASTHTDLGPYTLCKVLLTPALALPSLRSTSKLYVMDTFTSPQVAKFNGQPGRRDYFIFGYNISHSLSPTLHNTGFRELGLPHQFSIHETPAVDGSVESIISQPGFGGAAVTFPHKLQIGSLLDSISDSAEKVGAVNTVISQGTGIERKLHGDNTDWIGISRCIERSAAFDMASSTGLVLGAGGAARAACYALQNLGISELLIVNRTMSKADEMAAHFDKVGSRCFNTLEEAVHGAKAPLRVIVACVPADDLGKDKIPAGLFSGSDTGVLVEMAYRPQMTGMMETAADHKGWRICRGIDVLEEQAYEQFQMWTGQPAPKAVMRTAMQTKARSNM